MMLPNENVPTRETYTEFQQVYDFYNARLFDGLLPNCLITLHRRSRRNLGFFAPGRFAHRSDTSRRTDEICMNPQHFKARSDIEILSTLVHEMCHLWQEHLGKPSRWSFHNKEWGNKMESIGLMPSNTGLPGGKRTGRQMTHYQIEGGRFLAVTKDLLDSGFKLSWQQRDGATLLSKCRPDPAAKSGKRVKFTCRTCDANAWGKSTLKLICGRCNSTMVPFELPPLTGGNPSAGSSPFNAITITARHPSPSQQEATMGGI